MNKMIEDKFVSGLRGLYARDQSAKVILDYFATRKKALTESTADRVAGVVKLSYPEVIRVFKELDGVGCGQFKNGRKGYKTRMVWNHNLVSVGEVAQGQSSDIPAVVPVDAVPEEDEPEAGVEVDEAVRQHSFQLRPDLIVQLPLPVDLTAKEAERVAAFIRTLPFE